MSEYILGSHCSYCGTKFIEQTIWPRKCYTCQNDSYKNPIPIVVSLIQTVNYKGEVGLLIQRRNIEPKKGELALPGGYIEFNEAWQEAAVRENMEEMGMKSVPEDYELWDIRKPGSGNMLIFCAYKGYIYYNSLADIFIPNTEVLELGMWHMGDPDLAFPTHNEMGRLFLQTRG